MTDDNKTQEDKIEKEIRDQQNFSVSGAIGRAGGGGMLKGASPIPKNRQASNEMIELIRQHCPDPSGALKSVLSRRIKNSGPLLEKHLDNPNAALVETIQTLLGTDSLLHEFVRQVDMRWGELYQERPHFQQPGQIPHPDDEYTHDSVRKDLATLLHRIERTG